MTSEFLLYGATGFVGEAIARHALERGLRPVVAGRDPVRVAALAAALRVKHRTFALEDSSAMDAALTEVPAVLHCAGPYIQTAAAMVGGAPVPAPTISTSPGSCRSTPTSRGATAKPAR